MTHSQILSPCPFNLAPKATQAGATEARPTVNALLAEVHHWWEKHQHDTVPFYGADEYTDERNLYDEPPEFVRIAQAMTLGGNHTFQERVSDWMAQCFLPSLYSNMTERGDRLLEEVLELLQAHGYDRSRVAKLVDYVYGRPVGEPAQEVGGVMVTLAGFCWIARLDMHASGEAELARINQPDVMAKIRAKQEAKNALHFDTPLPGDTGCSE